jgi:hypothetical protein
MKSSRGFPWPKILGPGAVAAFLLLTYWFFTVIAQSPGVPRKAIAKNDVVQIATAITAYETEYGKLPSPNGDVQDVGGPVLQALLGSNADLNPLKIVFLDVPAGKNNRGGLRDGKFVDPWGSPYKMKFDTDSDNKVQNVGPAQNLTAEISKKVAVWNDPDTHADRPNEKTKQRRAVTSWN